MIDLVFVLVLIIAVVNGYRKGFIIGLFSIFAFVIGLAAALKLSAAVAGLLEHHVTGVSKWLPLISFALVFFIVVFLVHLGAKLIEKTIELALLGWINRLAGVLLYVALYTLIFSVFLFYAAKLHFISPATITASTVYPIVAPLGPKLVDVLGQLIPLFKDSFAQLESFFAGMSNKIQP